MLRRHLRLPSSSEDDEDAPPPQTLITPNPNTLLEISDDDFLDVPDDLSPPVVEAPPGRAGDSADAPGGMEEERDGFTREIDDFLRSLGLRLRPEWLESCAATLMASGSDFSRLDVAGRAKRCFEQFLISDMNTSGAGVLPEYVHRLHKTELEGPFVLQIDEIVNISAPIRERYHEVPVGYKRCLKLSMTDGVQRVFGMEYRPIKELEVLASSGLKVVVHNVHIRRGLLMLVPEIFTVLGGLVEDLDAARKRLVAEVNKPPRGKRKRGNMSPLSTRACLAAWPSNNVLGAPTNSTTLNSQVLDQGTDLVSAGIVTTRTTIPEFVELGTTIQDDPCIVRHSNEVVAAQSARIPLREEYSAHIEENITEGPACHGNRSDMLSNSTHNPLSTMEHAHSSDVEDAVEIEHPLILSDLDSIPFTYLACLFAKWTTEKDKIPPIHGRIKCFLTGVKGFQFKERRTYELSVYVDDGSLISEVLIDHKVVQNGIGHSPEEVTAALSSTEKRIVADMRETMKKFQLFLAKFEGTMLLEMNKSSSLPVVLEMNQGISSSDACLLLKRLEKTVSQEFSNRNLNLIELSP
ncbi:recQ-mediated genome instability protein 1-like isoform X1 [Zingiber officinale]|uniref:recQ-mediated genome instability protein 1-like isoform X1 n=1 Tax=Zingiber officinale TaxID=94328 RepID=UPI001C4B48A1|nr:recQ-mediated genome instability protein 1-like isoform X1 [Zingiber officinale]XP_042461574.1 recQ-mediated genome instability protein 1-like isoform X1 [Zingiber officinale]XP_042461575.1 recQ-mediated genome instability protein 1-like isoform X1 [Zingiber officinale]